jgi:hypothetical protein
MLVVTRRLVALSAAALMTVAALGACTQPSPEPSRSTAPAVKHTPAFASDADALKAATDAYAAYLKMSDTIAHDGGANPERIAAYASGRALERALADVKEYRARGVHTTGNTRFDSARLQSVDVGPPVSIVVYLCDDVSDVDVLNRDGQSLVNPDRTARTPFEVTADAGRTGHVTIRDRELWQGANYC